MEQLRQAMFRQRINEIVAVGALNVHAAVDSVVSRHVRAHNAQMDRAFGKLYGGSKVFEKRETLYRRYDAHKSQLDSE